MLSYRFDYRNAEARRHRQQVLVAVALRLTPRGEEEHAPRGGDRRVFGSVGQTVRSDRPPRATRNGQSGRVGLFGQLVDDGTLLGMNWYVQGVDDKLPE
jgi:hypothetical protein